MDAYRTLGNGIIMELSDDGRAYRRATCHWLVEVPSGNPEPDCYEDTIRIVECDAPLTWVSESGASFTCEAGHHHVAYTEGGADIEWAREMEERAA